MRGNFSALLAATPLALAAASLLARRRWSFVAGAFIIIALALWLAVGADGAFVAATLGVVAWFWDQRNRLRALVIEDEPDDARRDDDDDGGDYFEGTDEVDETNGADGFDEEDANGEEDEPGRRARS
ncbi:MAG TPA: hypothetical protein VF538_01270 [Pyrinomonadaceae bacterium]|jgi:hypothetical protein